MEPNLQKQYRQIIESRRDTLSDDEMEVFLTLYEQGSIEQAATELAMSSNAVAEIVDRYIPKKKERIAKDGKPYRQRLGEMALGQILNEYAGMDESERMILESLIGAKNQVVAATSLNMNHSAFMKQYRSIRQKYDF